MTQIHKKHYFLLVDHRVCAPVIAYPFVCVCGGGVVGGGLGDFADTESRDTDPPHVQKKK